jgi:LmbE family N-acetylglucosaminyl deacetylase
MRVLHVAPHPDDELLGSPATLLALADAGHDVVNLAVSLGTVQDRARREAELREASARIGFELRVCSPPIDISRDDDLPLAQARLTEELLGADAFDLLIGPSPHDGHHGHEVVGRAVLAAAERRRVPVWLWALWSELPVPTILHPFERAAIERITDALSAYTGELARNDYRRLLAPRAEVTAVLGPERVFGFGAQGIPAPYAEALCEVVPASGELLLGTPRLLDPLAPLAASSETEVGAWLRGPSPRDMLGR